MHPPETDVARDAMPPMARRRPRPDADFALERARFIANLLDQRFTFPGTNIRFGYDAIVGLIPGIGDTATTIIGLYPVLEARRLGIRKRIIARMLLNLGLDWLIGLIPLLDIVFDVAYKANMRNVRLLEKELTARTVD